MKCLVTAPQTGLPIKKRPDFGAFIHTGTSITDSTTEMAEINWDAMITALHEGQLPSAAANSASSARRQHRRRYPRHACATPSPAWTTGT